MKQWHLTQCVARDSHAIEWLGRRGLEVYYPMVREVRALPRNRMSHNQRKLAASGTAFSRTVLRPLLARYVFTRFDVAADDWRSIFDIAGVAGIAMRGGLPAPVRDAIVEELRMREVDGAVPGRTPARLVFAAGVQVRVTEGPFVGHNAIVERELTIEEMSESDILVSLDIFGRKTRVKLPIDHVQHLA